MEKWIPVSSGKYPTEKEIVQVTYLCCYDQKPLCDAFAYRKKDKWHWTEDDEEVRVDITAWKKNCKPYNFCEDYVGEITGMMADIKFDRPIDKNVHIISPGGYSFVSNSKTYQFDFMDYEGYVDKDDPTILHVKVYNLDKDYSDDLSEFNSEKVEQLEEFYIYTGEENDPEINPVTIMSLSIEQKLTLTPVKKELLQAITF